MSPGSYSMFGCCDGVKDQPTLGLSLQLDQEHQIISPQTQQIMQFILCQTWSPIKCTIMPPLLSSFIHSFIICMLPFYTKSYAQSSLQERKRDAFQTGMHKECSGV